MLFPAHMHNARGRIIALFLLLTAATKNFSQDSRGWTNFSSGINPSSITAAPGYQSVMLKWGGIDFTATDQKIAGYLIMYSTGTPEVLAPPDGYPPAKAVINGTIVGSATSSLPESPQNFCMATGLTNGTTYHFMLMGYIWDGYDLGSFTYSPPVRICVTIPPDSPNGLHLQRENRSGIAIGGFFHAPLFQPDGYLVSYGKQPKAPVPADGTVYASGQPIEEDTVIQSASDTSFNTFYSSYPLSPSTRYYVHIYAYSISGCTGNPVYALNAISDSITTLNVKNEDSLSTLSDEDLITDIIPNPVEGHAWLKAVISGTASGNLVMLNAEGKAVWKKSIQLTSGNNLINLPVINITRGIYLLKIVLDNGYARSIRFIKQ